MSRPVAWFLVLVLLGGFVAAVAVLLRARAEAGKGLPAYSIYSEAGDGLGETAHVLRLAGYTPLALTRSSPLIGQGGLLVIVQPGSAGLLDTGGLSEQAAKALLAWVKQGNTILFCGKHNTHLHRLLDVYVTEGPPGSADVFTAVNLTRESPYLADVESLSVSGGGTLSVPEGAEVLWRLKDGPGAVLVSNGKGKLIFVADPDLLTRRGLVRADGEPRDDNVVFLVNVAQRESRQREVLFDEYDHGFHASTGFWGYLGYYDRRWVLFPVLIVLGLLAWRVGLRLGPAVPTPPPVRDDAVAYAAAVARLYQKAGARGLLARILVRDFLEAVTAHLRLRRTALPALILSAWREQDQGPSSRELGSLLRSVAGLRKGRPPEREMLAWARASDRFKRKYLGMTAGKGRRPSRQAK